MKRLLVFIVCLTIATSIKSYTQDTTKKANKEGFKLIVGGTIGLGAANFSFTKQTPKAGGEVNLTSGLSTDILNEFSVVVLTKFDKTWGIGTEVGRLTYFESALGIGTNTVNSFISGLYVAPFLNVGQFKFGCSYMMPNEESFFFRANDNIATDVRYSSFTENEKELIKKLKQPHIAAFVRYDYEATTFADLPIVLFGKLSYDIQFPLDKGLTDNYKVEHFRGQLTLGGTLYFDLVK